MAPQATQSTALALPFVYRLFFLVLEPLSALSGAICAHFYQHDYLSMTHAVSSPSPKDVMPTGTSVTLSQLGNMYLFFALNEALVLRSTADLRVWKTVLLGLLIGDLGHLYTLLPLGTQVYWDVGSWGPMDIGNVPIVYIGACLRIAFLLGVGLGKGTGKGKGKAAAKPKAK